MKKVAAKIGIVAFIILAAGLIIDTGSVTPPDNTLVYLNPSKTVYYPPTRVPENSGYIPVSYKDAKRIAEPFDPQGFNIDGPPLLISILESVGVISGWPSYWYGTNVPVRQVKYESNSEK